MDADADANSDADTDTGAEAPPDATADADAGTDARTTADAVTGPPDGMVDVRTELTPMLSQYFDLCAAYEDALVLFQNGDFYQTYCEAAEETARVCELTLTKREDSTGTYPMAGIPVENAASYVERLLEAGYRVAVAEQVERPSEASGLVDRAVTRVVTPGTVVDDDLLGTGTTNYVAAVTRDDATRAVAAVDVATGDCLVTSVDDATGLAAELDRLGPAELLVGPEADVDPAALSAEPTVTDHPAAATDVATAAETLSAYVSTPDAVVEADVELRACGAVLAYAEWSQGGDGPLAHVTRVTRYDPRAALGLDATATRGLELFENRDGGQASKTLFDVLDDTACALGRRELEGWLRRPLVDRAAVEARHGAVAELVDSALVRETIREALREVYDLERLAGRVARERADARDLRSLAATLDAVPEVTGALAEAEATRLRDLRERIDPLGDVGGLIDRAIRPDPPVEVTEGGVIREGFDDELDDLRATEREGRAWVADLETRERERTGIDSLSVGHNQVHGYYIEVTDSNLDRVPDDYTRRQTLKNAERFYTPELKRREDEILGAAERADTLEYERFREVRSSVAAETDRIQALAGALAELGALATLATVAVDRDYVRPVFHGGAGDRNGPGAGGTAAATDGRDATADDDGVRVAAGRHPVVETTRDRFVPNDAELPPGSITLVTGPNMSGKSTYMRQVALIVVLAQAGSFVPADAARLPIVDRVFTRVGASDDIAGGQSTFMREMAELTEILHEATADSLVLLDEVGRGTSTADGRAIARATVEFLHDEVGATTLFATHYHDLTELADEYDRVRNLHFAADRGDEGVTFLHRVAEGPASSSYGVEVARMAGVPDPVVARSRALVDGSDGGADRGDAPPERGTRGETGSDAGAGTAPDAEAAGTADDDVAAAIDALRGTDLATTTPIEALNLLATVKERLEEP